MQNIKDIADKFKRMQDPRSRFSYNARICALSPGNKGMAYYILSGLKNDFLSHQYNFMEIYEPKSGETEIWVGSESPIMKNTLEVMQGIKTWSAYR